MTIVYKDINTIRTAVGLDRIVREGSMEYHKLIMLSEIEPFFENNKEIFAGKSVLDLGCGEAFARRILRRPGFKSRYKGVDIGHSCIHDCDHDPRFSPKPDMYGDYRYDLGLKKESFDIVMALFPAYDFTDPENLARNLKYLAGDGRFVHSASASFYQENDIAKHFKKHLLPEKIEQYITTVVYKGKEMHRHNNIFSIWTKISKR